MISEKLVGAPVVEPVSLDETKAHLRIDDVDDDGLLSAMIGAARMWAERYTNRGFVLQTWRKSWDLVDLYGGGQRFVALGHAPVMDVVDVRIVNEGDVESVWGGDAYYLDNDAEPGRVVLRSGAVWPCGMRENKSFTVTYRCGFGAAAADVPEGIKLAIKQLVAHWYEHRGEALLPGTANEDVSVRYGSVNVPLLVQALLNPYRVLRMGS